MALARLGASLARVDIVLARLDTSLARIDPALARLNASLAQIGPTLARFNTLLERARYSKSKLFHFNRVRFTFHTLCRMICRTNHIVIGKPIFNSRCDKAFRQTDGFWN